MVNNNKYACRFIALAILSSCLSCTKLSSTQDDPTLKWLAGGVGVVVVGGIIKMACDRSKAEADRVKVQAAQAKTEADQAHALKEALEKPTLIVERHGTLIDIIAHDPVAAQNPVALSETSLRSYGPHFKNQRSCIASSLAELSSSIKTISDALGRTKNDNEQNGLKAKLQEQKELKKRLEIAQECINTYESFCNLETMQVRLSEKHAPTMKLLESHPELQKNPPATISSALKPFFNTALSIQHASSRQEPNYPYATYVHDTGRDIQQAQEIIKQASNRYAKLAQDTQELINKLTPLHHIARNSTEYHNDRTAYEAHQKEQQEFKLKQEHCAKLEQIARAAAQDQTAIQRDILKETQDRLREEQARLAEERAHGSIKRARLKIAQELPDQIKAIAASQVLLQQTVNSRMATVETQQKTVEARQAALEKKQATAEQEVNRLKSNATHLYVTQNNQQNHLAGLEGSINRLQTAVHKLSAHEVAIEQNPPAYQEQTPPPYQEDNRSNCAS